MDGWWKNTWIGRKKKDRKMDGWMDRWYQGRCWGDSAGAVAGSILGQLCAANPKITAEVCIVDYQGIGHLSRGQPGSSWEKVSRCWNGFIIAYTASPVPLERLNGSQGPFALGTFLSNKTSRWGAGAATPHVNRSQVRSWAQTMSTSSFTSHCRSFH